MQKKEEISPKLIFFNYYQHFSSIMSVKLKCQIHNLIECFCFNNFCGNFFLSQQFFFFYWRFFSFGLTQFKFLKNKKPTTLYFLFNSNLKNKKRRRLENLRSNDRILMGSFNKKLLFLYKHSKKTFYNFSGKTRFKFFESIKTLIVFKKNRKFYKKKSQKGFILLNILIQNFFSFEKFIKNNTKIGRRKNFKINKDIPFYLKEKQKIGKVIRKCIHLFFWTNKEKFHIITDKRARYKTQKECSLKNKGFDVFSSLELLDFSTGFFEKIKMLSYTASIYKILKKRKINTIPQYYDGYLGTLVNEYGCSF